MTLQMLKKIARPLRRRMNQMLGRDVRFRVQVRRPTLRLGSEYGGWVVCPDLIRPDSIIYAFGVGEDISFDLAMIQRFNVTVHAFDPTPKAMQWVRAQSLPEQFVFHNIGLADYDGVAHFVLPRADFASYHIADADERGAHTTECEVKRLSTIMQELHHTTIDLLKMDIEGAEYTVIDDLLSTNIRPQQLLIEFHHTIGDKPSLARTQRAVESLNAAGYRIFAVSPVGVEYSFIR